MLSCLEILSLDVGNSIPFFFKKKTLIEAWHARAMLLYLLTMTVRSTTVTANRVEAIGWPVLYVWWLVSGMFSCLASGEREHFFSSFHSLPTLVSGGRMGRLYAKNEARGADVQSVERFDARVRLPVYRKIEKSKACTGVRPLWVVRIVCTMHDSWYGAVRCRQLPTSAIDLGTVCTTEFRKRFSTSVVFRRFVRVETGN